MIAIIAKRHATIPRCPATRTHVALWVAQVALAATFIFAGIAKLAMPSADLEDAVPLPVLFMRFIALAELLGGLGLVLPGLSRTHTYLTPLAAAGLVVIMVGAVITTMVVGPVAGAPLPAGVGAVAAWVAYARSRNSSLAVRRR
jgi:hypothetical protein